MSETSSKASRKERRCPICGRPSMHEARPFCSRRCADVDLGRWLKGVYRVPTAETPAPDAEPGGGGDGDDA